MVDPGGRTLRKLRADMTPRLTEEKLLGIMPKGTTSRSTVIIGRWSLGDLLHDVLANEVPAAHPEHTKRFSSLLAVLWQTVRRWFAMAITLAKFPQCAAA